jgi:pimeloyl-ACP methyl ester carboxylesterase
MRPDAAVDFGVRETFRYSPSAFTNGLIEEWLRTGERSDIMEQYFGAGQYREIQSLLREAGRHAAADAPLVLILPGIMSSRLGRPVDAQFDDILWLDFESVALGRLSELSLATYRNDVGSLGIILTSYIALKLRLRILGFDARFFAYDWRKGLDELGASLAKELQRLAPRRVHLVAHSMGGMVARAALKHSPQNLGRVVMLGTPNQGSFVPVQIVRGVHSVVKKLAALDPVHSQAELARDVFGTFPGLTDLFPCEPGADLFCADAWPETGNRPQANELSRGRATRAQLPASYDDLVLVAGVDHPTVMGACAGEAGFEYHVTSKGDSMIPAASVWLPRTRIYYLAERHHRIPSNPLIASAVGDILKSGTTSMLGEHWTFDTHQPRILRERPPSEQVMKARPAGNELGRMLNGAASMSALEFL